MNNLRSNNRKYKNFLTGVIVVFIAVLVFSLGNIMLSEKINGTIFVAILFVLLVLLLMVIYRIEQNNDNIIKNMSFRFKKGEQESLVNIPLGIIMYSEDNKIQWINPKFQESFKDDEFENLPLEELSSGLVDLYSDNQEDNEISGEIEIKNKQFDVLVIKDLRIIYLYEISQYKKIENKYLENKASIGFIFLDNYDEITQNLSDKMVSNLSNFVTNQVVNWANKYDMYLKRIDDDRFLVVSYVKDLKKAEDDDFKILDIVREETSKRNYPLTLSMGFSYGEDNLIKLAEGAQNNLDLALGRGGDQVVIKAEDEKARFYGGSSNPMEKRTRVRSRMISQALQDIIIKSDKVFVMGHSRTDMDAFGASLGIRRIAEMNGKQCYVVFDNKSIHDDVQRMYKITEDDDDISPYLISSEKANNEFTKDSLLVLVDHSKKSISISPDLIDKANGNLVVIDHHRRGEEFPESLVLSYIEPYASSTCELITEMLEYQPKDASRINRNEATAMLAGITVDTKSFALRTGTRTFDSASYLRSVGASESMVQEVLKENIDSYVERNKLIETGEMYDDGVVICKGEDDKIYDSVIGAQAADTLLSLNNIEASFVITRTSDDTVSISARSLGSVNVQIIMEEMGGGGHLSNAASQIKNSSVDEAEASLKETLDNAKKGTEK